MDASRASVTVTVRVSAASPVPRDLARTGVELHVLVALALLLIVAGATALLIARTRLENPHA